MKEDYIPRSAVLSKTHDIHVKSKAGDVDYSHRCIDPSDVETIPAADVATVVHGTWDKGVDYDPYGGGRYVEWSCSECCHIVKRGWAVRDKNSDKKPTENYCPNCGARMDGDLI